MEDKIKEIIKKHFGTDPLEIKKISEGFSHHMYDVKIDKKPFELIVRFTNTKKPQYSLNKERFIMKTLEKIGLPVPKIYFFFEDEKKNEEYMVLEKLKGERLDSIWEKLDKKEKVKLVRKIGLLASKIHSIHFENFGRIEKEGKIESDVSFSFKERGNKETFDASMRHILVGFAKDFSRFVSYNNVDRKGLAEIISFITTNSEKIGYLGKPTLIHGDFHIGHFFVTKEKGEYEINGLIDFEFAESSVPEFDFIKLHRLGFFEDKEILSALEEGYGREINKEALEIYRLMRDVGFAQVLLESGDKVYSDKILEGIYKKIRMNKK